MKKSIFTVVCLAGVVMPGCLFVRTTEHRIQFHKDGGGEAMVRMIDIRSDAESDSAVNADFRTLMDAYVERGLKDFEEPGREVTGKRLVVRGDTLMGEITYNFVSWTNIEGLRATKDEFSIVIPAQREVVKTNGSVQDAHGGAHRIVWDRDENRLMYQVRELRVPPSESLASRYVAAAR